jgi:hypothetical protein
VYSPVSGGTTTLPENVRRAIAQLVWEVRWDGTKNGFTVILDETAIGEAHVSIMRREEERAKKSKQRRRRPRRARTR